MKTKYGYGKQVNLQFEDAVKRVYNDLQSEGFGVLTDIDVAAKIKEKLSLTIPPYRIIGACIPSFANQALAVEPMVGLLMPCNIVVRENGDKQVFVDFQDPNFIFEAVGKEPIRPLMLEVNKKLQKIFEQL
jgi:uncharacterized protein (DUF302 family)